MAHYGHGIGLSGRLIITPQRAAAVGGKCPTLPPKLRVHTVHSSRGDRLGTPIQHAHKVDMVHPHRELGEEANG